jgi:hypothetical protein
MNERVSELMGEWMDGWTDGRMEFSHVHQFLIYASCFGGSKQ